MCEILLHPVLRQKQAKLWSTVALEIVPELERAIRALSGSDLASRPGEVARAVRACKSVRESLVRPGSKLNISALLSFMKALKVLLTRVHEFELQARQIQLRSVEVPHGHQR